MYMSRAVQQLRDVVEILPTAPVLVPPQPDVPLEPQPQPADKDAYSNAFVWAGLKAVEKEMSLRDIGKDAQIKFKLDNPLSTSTVTRASMRPGLPPCKPGPAQKYPLVCEQKLLQFIVELRASNLPTLKCIIMGYACKLYVMYLEKANEARDAGIAIGVDVLPPVVINYYPNGMTESWYKRFLRTYVDVIGTSNQTPLEQSRAQWATSKNICQYYRVLRDALLDLGLCYLNPAYDETVPFDEKNPANNQCVELLWYPGKLGRVFSMDETKIVLSTTDISRRNSDVIIVPKDENGKLQSNETLAIKNDGGQDCSMAGGSLADGRALPALYIFTGGYYLGDMKDGPDSDIVNFATGKFFPSQFTSSPSGGMTDDIMLDYIQKVVQPIFTDLSVTNPVLGILDGYGSHFTLEVLEHCRSNHITLLLRVPHCSHIIQGEDVSNFGPFKARLAAAKS